MENRKHQTFHVGLKAFLAQGDKLLILQDEAGLWELPGGRTEKTENNTPLPDILRREVAEELGESVRYEVGPMAHAWIRKPDLSYPGVPEIYRTTDFCIFLVGFRCEYISGDIQISPEHQAYRWVTKEEAKQLEFENTYKEAVQKYFENL